MRPLKWIKITNPAIRNELPKDKVFLALWKGCFAIAEYDEDEDRFYICFMPACMSGIMKVAHEREGKFTHYCNLEYPEDY